MHYTNQSSLLYHALLTRIVQLFLARNLCEGVDRIPLELRPRSADTTRCCVYRDRALLKYRCMALLGFGIEEETDELQALATYARHALERSDVTLPILTVIDEACSACIQSKYLVTDACRGCLARPCTVQCRKQAISVVDGKAAIDSARCINCGKCLHVCPYHAIIYAPIPCEEQCPVGAIQKGAHGKVLIDHTRCIRCGKCLRACPFGAIMHKSQIIDVVKYLQSDRPVIALIAPAISGQFAGGLHQVTDALAAVGFAAVAEVAWGASVIAAQEAQELIVHLTDGTRVLTSFCCPAYAELVRLHLPELRPLVSTAPTPLHVTACHVKERYPDAVLVFISPCIAKKDEALADVAVDYVLTFEEIAAIFEASQVTVATCTPRVPELVGDADGRGFAVSGGVCAAVKQHLDPAYSGRHEVINGLSRQTVRKLKGYAKRPGDVQFLEVMACEGGCVGGPCTLVDPAVAAERIALESGREV